MKTKNEEILLPYPAYRILPWEKDFTKQLGVKAHEKKYKKAKTDRRDDEEALVDSISGMTCELALQEMFSKKAKNRIIFSSIHHGVKTGEFNSNYDLGILGKDKDGNDKEFTIDIKATSTLTSKIIKSPFNCNFVLSYSLSQRKKWYGSFCDYYVQMFWDENEDILYFVGALTGKTVEEFVERRRTPERRGSTSLVLQKDFDATKHILPLIDKQYRIDHGLQTHDFSI